MRRIWRIGVVVFLVTCGWQVAHSQDGPAFDERLLQFRLEQAVARREILMAETESEAVVIQQRVDELTASIEGLLRPREEAFARARELGVEPRTSRNLQVHGFSGTYVFADEFRLDPETNNVEAVGNVVVTTWRDGYKYSMRTDHLTIGEGF